VDRAREGGAGGAGDAVIALREVAGPDVGPWLTEVARLRMAVFREFPYLYDGDLDYERDYLATYARSPESLFVLAFDGARVVGASTAVPLADEVDAFRKPFRDAGIDAADVFYFWTAFCAVVRAADDPRRPPGHRGNETLWQRRGYARRDGMRARLEWKEIGTEAPVMHELAFWLRLLS